MLLELTPEQCRVIGVLLEKEITTPDQYPLSLNGLMTGCNQKSSRDPVMQLTESDVQNIVDELKQKRQINEQTGFGSRVVKYKHRFCNTEFGDLQFSSQQLALVCVLLLRGPQTPGELRTRTNRLAEFDDVNDVEATLEQLQDHQGEQIVAKLPREAGRRDSRYVHLFWDKEAQLELASQPNAAPQHSAQVPRASSSSQENERIDTLETEVAELKIQVAKLTAVIEELM